MDGETFNRIFYGPSGSAGPHTLDSPIRYEVWRQYALRERADARADEPVELLLEPREDVPVLQQMKAAFEGTAISPAALHMAYLGDVVAVRATFEQFLTYIVPLTRWGELTEIGRQLTAVQLGRQLLAEREPAARATPAADELSAGSGGTSVDLALPSGVQVRGRPLGRRRSDLLARFRWFLLLAARIGYLDPRGRDLSDFSTGGNAGAVRWLKGVLERTRNTAQPVAFVSHNRPATLAVHRSRSTIKADASYTLFNLDGSAIGWAVLDTGIDATHPAFRQMRTRRDQPPAPYDTPFGQDRRGNRLNLTRVRGTWDLRRARDIFARDLERIDLETRLLGTEVEMLDEASYPVPAHDHGTHVAGILGGNWIGEDGTAELVGMCPDIRLYDLRVLGDDGEGDEFSVIAGLRLVEALNNQAGRQIIHGVNLSLSITHHVANYACGFTPVCRACDDLISTGVVVVAAAGNTGFTDPERVRRADGTNYNMVSITDPGNAEGVITVGATDAASPYRYGTSYFSARGPTADGRPKPDLLAPGQGITGPIPVEDLKSYDGTSQAAPHVSGAAAMLLSRYPELRGQPPRIKEILCSTASDLGRERYFQGYGLVDALRALQSV